MSSSARAGRDESVRGLGGLVSSSIKRFEASMVAGQDRLELLRHRFCTATWGSPRVGSARLIDSRKLEFDRARAEGTVCNSGPYRDTIIYYVKNNIIVIIITTII